MADPTSELAIDAAGVARRFGARWVLRGVTMQVRAGEIVGLLGANGSGKSTLLRILATLLQAERGSATVSVMTSCAGRTRCGAHRIPRAHARALRRPDRAREPRSSPRTCSGSIRGGRGLAPSSGCRARPRRRRARARLLGRHAAPPRDRAAAARRGRALLLLDEPYSNLDTGGHRAHERADHRRRCARTAPRWSCCTNWRRRGHSSTAVAIVTTAITTAAPPRRSRGSPRGAD